MEIWKNLDLADIKYFCEIDKINKIENWYNIKEYEGIYMLSDLGRVKRLSIKKLNGRFFSVCKEKILKPNSSGVYLSVDLNNDSVTRKANIHLLVAETFLDHKKCGMLLVINHINLNKLDNRKVNIEIVSNRVNSNKKHLKTTSKYVGVYWHKSSNKWASNIGVNGKQKHLGLFLNEYDAHLAYEHELSTIISKQDLNVKSF